LTSYNEYHGSSPEVKRPRRVANIDLRLVSRLRMSGAILLLPLCTFMAWAGEIYPSCSKVNLCLCTC